MIRTAQRTITSTDRLRLLRLLGAIGPEGAAATATLQDLLSDTAVVPGEAVPAELVTMNSQVTLAIDGGEPSDVTLVYPHAEDESRGRVSVLSPLGLALLGCVQGDRVEWSEGGRRRVGVIHDVVFQPERYGDQHL